MNEALQAFAGICARVIGETRSPSDIVEHIAPAMRDLPGHAGALPGAEHLRSDPAHHARNLRAS